MPTDGKTVSFSESAQVMTAARSIAPAMPQMVANADSDLGQFLKRYAKIATTTIDTTDVSGSVVATIDPWMLFLALPTVNDKTKNFSLIRGSIKVYGVVTVPGNCYGGYVVSDLVSWSTGADGAVGPGNLFFENCLQTDFNVRLDMASSTNFAFELPFVFPFDWSELPEGPEAMHTLFLFCLSPLNTSITGGVTTGHITWYASMADDMEMVVPKLQGKKHGGGDHMISQTAASISTVSRALSAVPIIGPFAMAASEIASGVASLASAFGFTRTSSDYAIQYQAHRSTTNLVNCSGTDGSESLSLCPVNAISIDPTLGGGSGNVDPGSFADLFSRWTHISTFTWSPDDAPGTHLLELPVTPSIRVSHGGLDFHTTTAGFVGMPFEYWRGDMEYMVWIPVSVLHRGAVQAFWVPHGSVVSEDPTNVSMNVIHDVSASAVQKYLIGYARAAPFLENGLVQIGGIVNSGFINGTFVLRVVNPLQSQNAAASVVGHVFARAGKNMDFQVPRDRISATDGLSVVTYPFSSIKLQGASGDEDTVEDVTHVLMPSSGAFPSDSVLFGETVNSVRALMQKPCLIILPITYNSIPVEPLGPFPNGAENIQGTTYAGYYRSLFHGVAASLRYKLIFPVGDGGVFPVAAVTKNGLVIGDARAMPTQLSATYKGSTGGYEINLPYYQRWKFVDGCSNESDMGSLFPRITYNIAALNDGNEVCMRAAVFFSFGPDIRLTMFRQTRRLTFAEAFTLESRFFSGNGEVAPP